MKQISLSLFVWLCFLPYTLLLDMKHDATARFMRGSIRCCYCTERFFLLYHTMHHCCQCSAGIPYLGCFGPGPRLPTIGGWLLHMLHRKRARLVP